MGIEEKPFAKAVRIVGSQTELARLCRTSQPRIWQCLHRNKVVPAELVLIIESATGGKVSRHELRPDLYPEPIPLDLTIRVATHGPQSAETHAHLSSSELSTDLAATQR